MNSIKAKSSSLRENKLEVGRLQEPGGILVVDDEFTVRMILKKTLAYAGYTVISVASGDEALELLASVRFHLVIIDLVMPGQDGIETILALRSRDPELSIIAMSGGGSAGCGNYLPLAATLGAKHTLAKPFGSDELLRAVRDEIGAASAPKIPA